jgi:YesN/AraC family two-component response regulator
MMVETEFFQLGFNPLSINLGEVVFKQNLSLAEIETIENAFKKYGFEVITDKRSQVIEQIKTAAIDYVFENDDDTQKPNFSDFLEKKLLKDYTYLSNLFSEMVGTTIEKHLINLKIERVKELLVYDELTLSEIAFQLGYSNVAYLSNQFKKITGLTPTYFKAIKDNKRQSIEKV